jgi:plasmid stability protein
MNAMPALQALHSRLGYLIFPLGKSRSGMGSLTVRKVDDEVMRDLRISAASRGVSMEQEARDRLRRPLTQGAAETHQVADSEGKRWLLKATKEELLALGRKPDKPIDHKAESDALYDYLDEL